MTPYQMTDGEQQVHKHGWGYMTLELKHEVRSTYLRYEERFAITTNRWRKQPFEKNLL
jgi:hypothetical protein